MFLYFITFLLTVLAYIFIRRKRYDLSNEHCLITGGTSGIGLALAIECAKLGASVTILARGKSGTPGLDKEESDFTDPKKTSDLTKKKSLGTAKKIISSYTKNNAQKILTFSVDITSEDANLKDIIAEAETNCGPVTFLFNCAGTSISKRFEDSSIQDFKDMLNVNYLGSVSVTQAVLPAMKERCKGKIIFVSSLAGLIGLYGYTAYSASKFALVGLAEALQMEMKPYNIGVTVSFPPDTATPGYAEEMKTKPIETAKISESGGLYEAEIVARKTLYDVLDNKFMSSVGLEGWMLCVACSGTTPVNSIFQLLIQVATTGLMRLGLYIYLLQCDQTIKKCFKERELKKN
ncbi:3-dehydrosphinganine reductase [Parasteatoda tepidariorum]|uniref:3-dehydrosphinganine reductase n=1 Tax=Parasteatoda tepidariorum TaxID=114398 RepID=UPI00077F9214|nr:3-ketodihydrosphingosine reductase [Parasteatoda tepidariorum]